MGDAFDMIAGQPRVADYLRRSIADGAVSHAYLFAGPAGSNKRAAATAFAQALVCEKDGCGTCEACRRVQRNTHPDVNMCEPQGATGYLIEQVREVVSDAALAPVMARRKVYIIDQADRFNTASANAFLKTLEEPPADVVIILLARTRESVLPTIASRCLVVPFRHIPAHEAAALVAQAARVSHDQARAALAACEGNIQQAREFCTSAALKSLRRMVIETLDALQRVDSWETLCVSQRIAEAAKAPAEDLKRAQEQDLTEKADYLSKTAQRQIEQHNKRELSAASRQVMLQVASIVQSWLRDVMTVSFGAPGDLANSDARESIERTAAAVSTDQLVAAIGAVNLCREHIAYNVSTQTCIDVMLLSIKKELFG